MTQEVKVNPWVAQISEYADEVVRNNTWRSDLRLSKIISIAKRLLDHDKVSKEDKITLGRVIILIDYKLIELRNPGFLTSILNKIRTFFSESNKVNDKIEAFKKEQEYFTQTLLPLQNRLNSVTEEFAMELAALATPHYDYEPLTTPPPKQSFWERLSEFVYRTFSTMRNPCKFKKYQIVMNHLGELAKSIDIPPGQDPSEIASAWCSLLLALKEPSKDLTPYEQYRTAVECLRKVLTILATADAETRETYAKELAFCQELSHQRFAGIRLFDYCQELVTGATGMTLPENLNLDTFYDELKTRSEKMNHLPNEYKMNPIARIWKNLKGYYNIWFDTLTGDNVPYLDGYLNIGDKEIRVLRHGVPFYHNNPGLLFQSEPIVNPDYEAFIEAAKTKNENILHVILEDGQQEKLYEYPRVKARLELGENHTNFYPLAFSLNSEFFETFQNGQTFQDLKAELNSLISSKDLEKTGYFLPNKIQLYPEQIDEILDEVKKLYFPDTSTITSIDQHQAFILLTYVHIILHLCQSLDISILEAACKDDVDRGNVIKTLLKLVYLYQTNKLSPETLNTVLVHTLAAPCSVYKRAIVEDRLVLLKRAIPFIAKAAKRNPTPQPKLFGTSST